MMAGVPLGRGSAWMNPEPCELRTGLPLEHVEPSESAKTIPGVSPTFHDPVARGPERRAGAPGLDDPEVVLQVRPRLAAGLRGGAAAHRIEPGRTRERGEVGGTAAGAPVLAKGGEVHHQGGDSEEADEQ